jgi:inner membrane protein
MSNPSFFEKLNHWIQNSISIKLFSIGILILLLLIPTSMISSLIYEREHTRQQTFDEVSSKWGYQQTITGPIISIPYTDFVRDRDNKLVEVRAYAHFLPEHLNISGIINPEIRYRSIYEVPVYNTILNISGNFSAPDFSDWNIPNERIKWDEASLSLGIPDMRGIRNSMQVELNNQKYEFQPGLETNDVIQSGVSVRIPFDPQNALKQYDFSIPVDLNGSRSLNFLPMGKITNVALNSTWANPAFDGAFLPEERTISADGFNAKWKILHLNRNFSQKWTGTKQVLSGAEFGVNLIIPVDHYQKSMRSSKYAIMLIALTFLIFFFVEVLNKRQIHPFQYILVGLALCLFYTLLISFSEYINFNLSYTLSSVATIILISLYALSVVKSKMVAGILAGVLSIIYGFIFIIIQLQDYALLMGSIGLFLALATVMYLSRKIDWYNPAVKSEGV